MKNKVEISEVQLFPRETCRQLYVDAFITEEYKEKAERKFDRFFPDVFFIGTCLMAKRSNDVPGWCQFKAPNGHKVYAPESFCGAIIRQVK